MRDRYVCEWLAFTLYLQWLNASQRRRVDNLVYDLVTFGLNVTEAGCLKQDTALCDMCNCLKLGYDLPLI